MFSQFLKSLWLLTGLVALAPQPNASAGLFSNEYHLGASYHDRAAPRNYGFDFGALTKHTVFVEGTFTWQPGAANPFFDLFTQVGVRFLNSPFISARLGAGIGMGGPYGTGNSGNWAQNLADAFISWMSMGVGTGATIHLSKVVGVYAEGQVRWRMSTIDKQPFYRLCAGVSFTVD